MSPNQLLGLLSVKIRLAILDERVKEACLRAIVRVARAVADDGDKLWSGDRLNDLVFELNGQLHSNLMLLAPSLYDEVKVRGVLAVSLPSVRF